MEKIVEKTIDSDENYFLELIKKYKKDMYLIAKTRLMNEEDICDAIQETVIIGYKNIKKLKQIEVFKTWIIKILINKCNEIYNKNKKNSRKIINMEKEIKVYNIDKTTDNIDSNLDFNLIINNLNYKEGLVITLHYGNDYTTKEISRILKVNENTVKTQIRRAKNKIRDYYCKGGINYER